MGEEVTSFAPPWLTTAWLGERLGAHVASVRTSRIGDGLVGMNLRLELDGDDSLPVSVVAKLPSLDPTSRASGLALRTYEREVKFYRRVASTVDIRVPHCFHAELDEPTGDFVLLLEDMAPAMQGDQLTGCDVATAERIVDELARLHGPRWDDPSLFDEDWLQRRTGDGDGVGLAGLWQMFCPGFGETYRRYLTDEQAELADRFGGLVARWVDERTGPWTVTHGDYRLDNMLLAPDDASGAPPVTVVDWQTPGHGVGVTDLSYFIGAGLVPERRQAHERALVERYAESLGRYGVSVDRSWLWEQYRRDAFAGLVMAVVASQVVEHTARGEAMFAAMATRHLQQALDLDSIEVL